MRIHRPNCCLSAVWLKGDVCALALQIATLPLDTAKVRLQLQGKTLGVPKYKCANPVMITVTSNMPMHCPCLLHLEPTTLHLAICSHSPPCCVLMQGASRHITNDSTRRRGQGIMERLGTRCAPVSNWVRCDACYIVSCRHRPRPQS